MVYKLKEVPKSWIVGLLTVIGFGIFITINLLVFRALPPSSYGILHYEFAWTVEKVNTIFAEWGSSGMSAQAMGVWWDFPYIIGYSLFIAGCILLVTRMNTGTMQNIGLYLTLSPFIAGLLDLVENIFLLVMLNNPSTISPAFPMIATIAAGIKFGLLIVGILYFLVALIWGIIRKIKSK